jgi:hypothetical protein
MAWALAAAFFALFAGVVLDATFQANGLYGVRTVTVETVVGKRMTQARRSTPKIAITHRGQRIETGVSLEEYGAIRVGQRLNVVIVPARWPMLRASPHVFLDRKGIKHNPHSRIVGFGVIVAFHFGLLFGLFQFLLARARRRSEERLQPRSTALLGMGRR